MTKYFHRLHAALAYAPAMAAFLLFQPMALACACCAEHGQWFHDSHAINDNEAQTLNRVQFASEAKTYLTAAGTEGIRGTASPAETYKLVTTKDERRWRWTFTDAKGQTGVLAFNIPQSTNSYGTDLRDGKSAPGGGPLLYKEWQMRGRVWGNGIFAAGMSGQPQFHLILQGRGNSCMSAGDWRHWRLEVSGQSANFAFYGDVEAQPATAAAAPLYFASPEAAIPVITELLRREDWSTLSRYYDLTKTDIERSELESGRFFLRTEQPEGAHPAGFWRYKHPFAPGYKYFSVDDVAAVGVMQVVVAIEIDQGDGTTQRGMSDFLMRQSEHGYQILPPH